MSVTAKVEFTCAVLLGAMSGALVAVVCSALFVLPDVREQAATAERLVWEQRENKALEDNRRLRDIAQTLIADAERGYVSAMAKEQGLRSALDAALAQEREDAEVTPGLVCRPAVPRRLRDALDPVGRP